MKKPIGLSGVALAALLIATAPAGAISLTIGGDGGLLSTGSGDSGGGGGSTSGGVSVEVGGDGGLLDLGGSSDSDAAVEVDLGLGTADQLVDIGTDSDTDGIIVDLFGSGDAVADVDIGLGGEDGGLGNNLISLDGDEQAAIIVDLFGSGADDDVADVKVDLGLGETGSGELLDVNGDGDAAVNVDLFGSDESSGDVVSSRSFNLALGSTGQNGIAGSGGEEQTAALSLFGDDGTGAGADDSSVDETETASISPAGDGSDGTGADDGTGLVQPAASGPTAIQPIPRPLPARPAASGRVASVGSGSASCFSPNQAQIEHLLGRKLYSADIATEWRSADEVRVVPINLCPDARARLDAALEADANIDTMQAAVASSAEITAAIEPSYEPDDVLAVDQTGEDLSVYVY